MLGVRETAAQPELQGALSVKLLLWLLIFCGMYLRFLWGSDFTYSEFTDRDLLRAFNLWDNFQYLGAESMRHTARTPGGAMAYFFNFLQQINPSADFIHTIVVLMDCVSLILIPVLFTRFLGPVPALIIAVFYGVTLVVLEEIWKFWNPSITPLFAVLAYGFLFAYVEERKPYQLAVVFALAGIAGQFHVSLYALLPLSLTFVFIAGIRPRFKDIAFATAALIATLLPYIIIDWTNGLQNTLSMMGPLELDEENKWSVEQVVLGIMRVTGGRTFPEATMPAILSHNRLIYWGAVLVFNIGFVALLIAGLFGLWRGASQNQYFDKKFFGRREWALVILLIISIFIAARVVNNNQGRYLIALTMPALLLMGVGIRNLLMLQETSKPVPYTRTIIALLLMVVFIKYGAITYHYSVMPRESASSYDVKKQVVDILKNDFGWSNHDIDLNVALSIRSGRLKTALAGGDENSSLNYIARSVPDATGVTKFKGCALVLIWGRRSGKAPPSDIQPTIDAIPFSNFQILKTVDKNDIRVIGYKTDNDTCYRSYNNRYILTPAEEEIEDAAGQIPQDGNIQIMMPDGTLRLISRLPNGSLFAVDLAQKEGRIESIIRGNSFRGLAASFRIVQSYTDDFFIQFTPVAGGPATVITSPYWLGIDGLFTPWAMPESFLPAGTYSVDFVMGKYVKVQVIARSVKIESSGPYTIRLTDHMEWPLN